MRIVLESEQSLRLEPGETMLTIVAPSEEQSYSAFHMLASSLATCTYSVLDSWASHAGVQADKLSIHVKWEFTDNPHRVGSIDLTFDWPDLPPEREAAARRAAALCAVHATLTHSPEVSIRSANETAQP